MPLADFLFSLDQIIWFGDFIVFCLLLAVTVKDKKLYSSLLTQVIVVLVGGTMVLYQPYLSQLYSAETKHAVNFAWYVGFTILDIVAIGLIFLLHKHYRVSYGFIANYNLFAYLILGVLQLVRYAERIKFNTDWFKEVYRYGIIAINVSTAAIALLIAVMALFSVYQIEWKSRRLAWKI